MSLTAKLIDQSTLNTMLAQLTPTIKLSDLLTTAGYSTTISHLQIQGSNQALNFSGCQFDHVNFSGQFQYFTFDNASFNHSIFRESVFSYSTFTQSEFHNCAFIDSRLRGSSFIQSHLETTKVWNSDFSDASFIDSTINNSVFAKAKFDNVLDYENKIQDMHIVFSQEYQVDYAFNQADSHLIKPTVALVGDAEWHDTPYYIVDKYDGNPFTISQYAPYDIQLDVLAQEVQKALNDINENGLNAPSIAQHVLKSDQPTINAIKDYAYKMIEKADAIWIPGGPDLHPEFYGENNTDSWPSSNYYREILEFSLTEAALASGKPILGICHGSQLVNVYLGGTLHQHVDGQSGISPELIVQTHEGLLGSVIDGPIHGPSYHHQAVKDIAPTLEVVATYNGVIKATQATDGSKVMLCQFHPEYEYDENSENILNQFMGISAENKILSKVIEISDVVDFGTPLDKVLAAEPAELPVQSQNITTMIYNYVAGFVPSFFTETAQPESVFVM